MEGKQFHTRIHMIVAVMCALLLIFFGVLYNLQKVNGAYYLEQSNRKIANKETVEAARGELLDRYGRVLVSNRATYQVTLDTSLMGKEEERNPNLLELIAVCRCQDKWGRNHHGNPHQFWPAFGRSQSEELESVRPGSHCGGGDECSSGIF